MSFVVRWPDGPVLWMVHQSACWDARWSTNRRAAHRFDTKEALLTYVGRERPELLEMLKTWKGVCRPRIVKLVPKKGGTK